MTKSITYQCKLHTYTHTPTMFHIHFGPLQLTIGPFVLLVFFFVFLINLFQILKSTCFIFPVTFFSNSVLQ